MHEFMHILASWEHWAFEAVSDLAFAALAYPFAWWRIRRHDRQKHGIGGER